MPIFSSYLLTVLPERGEGKRGRGGGEEEEHPVGRGLLPGVDVFSVAAVFAFTFLRRSRTWGRRGGKKERGKKREADSMPPTRRFPHLSAFPRSLTFFAFLSKKRGEGGDEKGGKVAAGFVRSLPSLSTRKGKKGEREGRRGFRPDRASVPASELTILLFLSFLSGKRGGEKKKKKEKESTACWVGGRWFPPLRLACFSPRLGRPAKPYPTSFLLLTLRGGRKEGEEEGGNGDRGIGSRQLHAVADNSYLFFFHTEKKRERKEEEGGRERRNGPQGSAVPNSTWARAVPVVRLHTSIILYPFQPISSWEDKGGRREGEEGKGHGTRAVVPVLLIVSGVPSFTSFSSCFAQMERGKKRGGRKGGGGSKISKS